MNEVGCRELGSRVRGRAGVSHPRKLHPGGDSVLLAQSPDNAVLQPDGGARLRVYGLGFCKGFVVKASTFKVLMYRQTTTVHPTVKEWRVISKHL